MYISHPLYNFDVLQSTEYFYNITRENQITRGQKIDLLPRTKVQKAIILFVINNQLGEILYLASSKSILYVRWADSRASIYNLFNIPYGTNIRVFDSTSNNIPPRLYLFAKFIDAIINGRHNSQNNVIDTFKILNPIFNKSLDLSEVYRRMKKNTIP